MLRPLLTTLCVLLATATAWGQALEVKAGSPLEIESLRVSAEVDEGVALVDVDQVFRNHTDAVQEGVYRFRLPEKAVIHSFSMWMNGKEKHGRVLEAQRARNIYDSIVARKKDPALLEEIGWRRFQVSVFPIPARETVRIRLVYAHVVDDDLGLRTLEIPLPEGAPVGVADVTVRVRDQQGVSVLDCPTHGDAEVLHDDVIGAVRWSAEGVTPQGPFRVRSAPAVEGLGLACMAFRPEDSSEGTFLVRVVPRMDDLPELPRDVIFVIDRSGSMKGKKLEQAQAALRYGLSTLKPNDRFSIVAFSSGVHQLGDGGLVPATDEWLDEARGYADALTASGGTNIDAALQQAMSLRNDEPGRLFVVSFLTDGNPTVGVKDPDRIVARYRERSAGAARLFAFGVGDDVKDFLLTRLASDSRGAAEYVRENEDLEVKLSALFDKVRSPILTDVEIRVTGDSVHVVGTEPEVIPDVFRGTAVVMAGRYTGSGPVKIRLTGRVGTTPVEARLASELPAVAGDKPHVAQIWARMRIDRLLDELRVHGVVEEIRQEIIALALKYQVVTPYTSFLVVEDGIHIPDDGELARVPEGPPAPDDAGHSQGGPSSGGGVSSHGGSYRGPASEVPPDSREPSDAPPAASGGGPTTPGGEPAGPTSGGAPGGPTTGGGDSGSSGGQSRQPAGDAPSSAGTSADSGKDVGGGGASETGGSEGGGGASGPQTAGGEGGGSSLGGGAARSTGKASRDYSWWRFWWETHRDTIYAVDERRAPPLEARVRDEIIVPALRRAALRGDEDPLVRSESQRALARWGDDAEHVRALAMRMLIGRPADGEPAFHSLCQENAARLMATGDMDGATRARLLAVLIDRDRRGSDVRACAALSLALGGPDAAGDVVTALLAAARESGSLRAAALLGLGVLGDDRALDDLSAMLDDDTCSDVERAFVVDALGRLRAVDRLSTLTRLLAERRTDVVVRRALPAAIARIAIAGDAADQRAAVQSLEKAARRDRDVSTQQFAIIALARVGTSPGVHQRIRGDASKALFDAWKRADARRPFVALALGLLARDGDAAARERLLGVDVADGFELQAGAIAALGMARSDAAVDDWIDVAVDRTADVHVRMQALDALASQGAKAAISPLRRALGVESRPDVRRALLATLTVLGDTESTEALLRALELGAADARAFEALARVGGGDVAKRLAAILRDDMHEHGHASRALAAEALGRMSGVRDPRLSIAVDFPYRAYSEGIWKFMGWR